MKIIGKTRVFGLLGCPVEHSLSPIIHNAAFKYLGLDCCYVPFLVRQEFLKDAVNAVKALNLAGINVTVPHKENVIPFLDEVDEEASLIGAVNAIVNKDGKLTGYNTDGRGFIKSMSEAHISVNKKKILILGAGGACRAISYYLSEKADRLFLYDIDKKKADRLIRDISNIHNNISFRYINKLDDIDIIINATPLGLKKNDPLPVSLYLIKPKHIVCDLIYKNTEWLNKASGKGCKTLNGMGMLLWQGAYTFKLFTGKTPPVDIMRKALLSNLK